MKTHLIAAITALSLSAPAAHATSCEGVDFDLRIAVQDALMGSDNPRVSRLAGYLNDRFYTDLTCRITRHNTPDEVTAMLANPAALLETAMSLATGRNQSDALMLILMAMQTTIDG